MHEVITKYISQIRFVPTLLLYSNLFNIASTLESSDEFENWLAKRNPDMAVLIAQKRRTGLRVESNSLTLTAENKNAGVNISSDMGRYATLFLEENKIERFSHVGLRRIGIYDTPISYEKYVNNFANTFFSNENPAIQLAADSIQDTIFVIEGIKDGYNTRLKIAPLKPDQLKDFFPFEEFTPEDLKLKQETSILIDLDVYSSVENNFDSTLDNLKAIESMHEALFAGLVDLVKDRTLK
jgi:hypothetical protein